jgi:hypothetical protein
MEDFKKRKKEKERKIGSQAVGALLNAEVDVTYCRRTTS